MLCCEMHIECLVFKFLMWMYGVGSWKVMWGEKTLYGRDLTSTKSNKGCSIDISKLYKREKHSTCKDWQCGFLYGMC